MRSGVLKFETFNLSSVPRMVFDGASKMHLFANF